MNAKDTLLWNIVAQVVNCCSSLVNGKASVTIDDVLGKSRSENVVMTRTILAAQIIAAGFSTSTVASLLHRDVHSIRHLINQNNHLLKSSKAYRTAYEDAEEKCKAEG